MFGLKEAEVATLVRAVAGEALDRQQIREHFARATWTGIAEPGDGTAGLLVEALGADVALDGLVANWSAPQFRASVYNAGVDIEERELQQAVERWMPRLASATALVALRQASRYGARLLVPGSPGWPEGLSDLGSHAPIAMWMRGNQTALAAMGRSIALVGARAATGYGEHIAMEAAAGLVDRGLAVVSGAAYGIDGMAHRSALASSGVTIAFLAGGVDRFYPSGHDALLTRIVEAGAVLSELPCGSPPTKWRFLQRNRLIAAGSQATVVLEAGWRSGSLNTAGHASQLGRSLGAVPGPVTSAASAGCHRLIRDYDAILVRDADDMAELVAGASVSGADEHSGKKRSPEERSSDQARELIDRRSSRRSEAGQAPPPLLNPSAEQLRILDALSARSPRPLQDIAARAGLSVASVQSILGLFELEGRVVEKERGWVKR